MKKEMMMVSLVLILTMAISLVSAFGASTPYWDEHPLKLAPGESTLMELTLQNMVGDGSDMVFKAEITNDGDGVAALVSSDTLYSVPFGTEDVKVPIRVVVPEDIAQGGKREVVVSFMQISSEEEGMVGVSGGFTTKFVVEVVGVEDSVLFVPPVVEPKAEEGMPMWGLILAIVIVLTIIIFWILKKKSKK